MRLWYDHAVCLVPPDGLRVAPWRTRAEGLSNPGKVLVLLGFDMVKKMTATFPPRYAGEGQGCSKTGKIRLDGRWVRQCGFSGA